MKNVSQPNGKFETGDQKDAAHPVPKPRENG